MRGLKVGQCLDDDQVGGFQASDCTMGHTYEVAAIVPNAKQPSDLKERNRVRNTTCITQVEKYIGGQTEVTSRRSIAASVSSDPEADQRIVCLTFPMNAAGDSAGMTAKVAKDVLRDPKRLLRGRVCLDKRTFDKGQTGETVPTCEDPHRAEAIAKVPLGKPGDRYPGIKELEKRARPLCTTAMKSYLGGVTRKDIEGGFSTRTQAQWDLGYVTAICFVNTAEPVRGSLEGIGNKPLADYR